MVRWRVLFYLAGADDLEHYMARALLSLEAMGPPPETEVIVQISRAPASLVRRLFPNHPPTGVDGDWHGVRRYRLLHRPPGGAEGVYHSELIADLGHISQADPANLADFVAYGMAQVIAERTLLIVSGHGMGFVGLAMDLTGDSGPSLMSIRGMATALRRQKLSVDLLLLDACQMNALEVVTQLALPRPIAKWLVVPATRAPRAGLDYPRLLETLADTGDSPTFDVAVRVAANLEAAANLQVLAIDLDSARWKRVAETARKADRAVFPPMLREAADACAYPGAGRSASLLVSWPDPNYLPARYDYLYRRLRFARLSGWTRYLPAVKLGSVPGEHLGPTRVPGPLMVAWLKLIRPDLSEEGIANLLSSLGGSVE